MALGSYKIPTPFKDEDKWLRFFTKKQLIVMGVALLVCVFFTIVFTKIHLTPIGLGIGITILIGVGALVFASIPADKYLIGGGYKLEEIALRVLWKKLPKHRKIYIKNYDQSVLDQGEVEGK